jgi:hypothetical protein
VTDFPTDKGIPLDGTVGSLSDLDETAAPATSEISRIRIFMSGDGVFYPGAMGLEEDLRLLVQAFLHGSRSWDRDATREKSASDAYGDIQIALHGLKLAPEEERELHHLVRELVRERLAGKEATK